MYLFLIIFYRNREKSFNIYQILYYLNVPMRKEQTRLMENYFEQFLRLTIIYTVTKYKK